MEDHRRPVDDSADLAVRAGLCPRPGCGGRLVEVGAEGCHALMVCDRCTHQQMDCRKLDGSDYVPGVD